jgi:hypothetical protein
MSASTIPTRSDALDVSSVGKVMVTFLSGDYDTLSGRKIDKRAQLIRLDFAGRSGHVQTTCKSRAKAINHLRHNGIPVSHELEEGLKDGKTQAVPSTEPIIRFDYGLMSLNSFDAGTGARTDIAPFDGLTRIEMATRHGAPYLVTKGDKEHVFTRNWSESPPSQSEGLSPDTAERLKLIAQDLKHELVISTGDTGETEYGATAATRSPSIGSLINS